VNMPTLKSETPEVWEKVFWEPPMIQQNKGLFLQKMSDAVIGNKYIYIECIFQLDPGIPSFVRGEKQYGLNFVQVVSDIKEEGMSSFCEFPMASLHEGVFLNRSQAEVYISIFQPQLDVFSTSDAQPPGSVPGTAASKRSAIPSRLATGQSRINGDRSRNQPLTDLQEEELSSVQRHVHTRLEKIKPRKVRIDGFRFGDDEHSGPYAWQITSPIKSNLQRKIASYRTEVELFDIVQCMITLALLDRHAFDKKLFVEFYRLLHSTAGRVHLLAEQNKGLRAIIQAVAETLHTLKNMNLYIVPLAMELAEDSLIHCPTVKGFIKTLKDTFPEDFQRPQTRLIARPDARKVKQQITEQIVYKHGYEDIEILRHESSVLNVAQCMERDMAVKAIAKESVLIKYLIDSHIDEMWNNYLIDLAGGDVFPPNPYPRLITTLRQCATRMDLCHEKSDFPLETLFNSSVKLVDPDNFVYNIPGLEAYGSLTSLMLVDTAVYMSLSQILNQFTQKNYIQKKGPYRVGICMCIAGPSVWYGKMQPYMNQIIIDEHYYIKGPAGCQEEAIQLCAVIVQNHVIELIEKSGLPVMGVYIGESRTRWTWEDLLTKKNAFVTEFCTICVRKEPISFRAFVLLDKWRYAMVIKRFKLHFLQDGAVPELFYEDDPSLFYQSIFLTKERAAFHYQNGGPVNGGNPMSIPNIRAIQFYLERRMFDSDFRCDSLKFYQYLLLKDLISQDKTHVLDAWRIFHSISGQIEYVIFLMESLQDLILLCMEYKPYQEDPAESQKVDKKKKTKIEQSQKDQKPKYKNPVDPKIFSGMVTAFYQKLMFVVVGRITMGPVSFPDYIEDKFKTAVEVDEQTGEIFLAIEDEMSLPKPSGLKTPSKLAKPSGLSQPKSGIPTPNLSRAQSPDPPAPPPLPPSDDFIIGDRVFVSGSKPGFISYLGETQFAPGEWAGVVLDEPVGKNDGSVSGVHYFQCEPKRGVFCRISKLSRTPGIIQSSGSKGDDAHSDAGVDRNGSLPLKRPTTPSIPRPTTPSIPRPITPIGLRPTTPAAYTRSSISRSLSGSNSSLNQSSTPTPAPVMSMSTPAAGPRYNLKVGDRVLVSGTKPGTLRFIGATDFAKGDWAGVELDDSMGKNDGAVAGKRYFECKPRYGLFAPVHKVTKITGSTGVSPQARTSMTSSRLSREQSGSQESVSSLSSTASNVSRSRVRLGVTALNNQAKTSQRPSSLNLSATTSALQKALKEKEEHIEQLLRERDLERAEVARAAAQVDEAENQITHLRVEQERLREDSDETVVRLKGIIQELEKEKHDLLGKLEDEKRKVEDLQFQIEEEVISKDDLESRTEEEEVRMRELEKALKKEKEQADKFKEEVISLKALVEKQTKELKGTEELQNTYLDQIEELTHKLSQAENKIKGHDSSRLEEGAKASQVSLELAEKSARVNELEDLLAVRDKEIKHLQTRLADMEEEMKSNDVKYGKIQKTIDGLTNHLNSKEKESTGLNTEMQNLKSQVTDLQVKLDTSKKKTSEVTEEKNMLERQIGELMKNSGSSSQKLSMLNEQLAEKTRKIQDLQADLLSSTQKLAKLNNEFESLKAEKDKEINILTAKNEEISVFYKSKVEDVQKELDKSRTKMKEMEDDLQNEKENLMKRKDHEISELRKQHEILSENLSKQEIQTKAHKQVLDQITIEKEAVQFEKEKVEKQVKRLEAEKESLNSELIQARMEVSKAHNKVQEAIKNRDNVGEKFQDLTEERDRLLKSKTELQDQKEEVIAERDKLSHDRDQMQRSLMDFKAMLQEKDIKLEELQKEVDRLRHETSQQQETLAQLTKHESSISTTLQQQLEASKQKISTLQGRLSEIETEHNNLKEQLKQTSHALQEEKSKMGRQNDIHNQELAKINQRHKEEVESLEWDKALLEEKVDNSSSLLEEKTKELDLLHSQVSTLENEKSMLSGYMSLNKKLEKEKEELSTRVKNLERKLAEFETNGNIINNSTVNARVAKLKEENETVDEQVSFLNAVIVDLQKKNDELKIRLEAMESGVINGAHGDSMEIDFKSPSSRAPPRIFCDICDVFDQHETEDCPLQEMSDSPPPTKYHGSRHQVRPYCDICEEFHDPCPGLKTFCPKDEVTHLTDITGKSDTNIAEDWTKDLDEASKQTYDSDLDLYYVQYVGSQQASASTRDSGYYDVSLDGKRPENEAEDSVFKKLREALKPFIQESTSEVLRGDISEKDILHYQQMMEAEKDTNLHAESSNISGRRNIGMEHIIADENEKGVKSSVNEFGAGEFADSSGITSQSKSRLSSKFDVGMTSESHDSDKSKSHIDGSCDVLVVSKTQSVSDGDFQSGKESLTSDDVETEETLQEPQTKVDTEEVFENEDTDHGSLAPSSLCEEASADNAESHQIDDQDKCVQSSDQAKGNKNSDRPDSCIVS
ncbi:hypothetical protein ACJMK2_012844, partial [Sinanodonta woodiana]